MHRVRNENKYEKKNLLFILHQLARDVTVVFFPKIIMTVFQVPTQSPYVNATGVFLRNIHKLTFATQIIFGRFSQLEIKKAAYTVFKLFSCLQLRYPAFLT